jgi:hypothetical protein
MKKIKEKNWSQSQADEATTYYLAQRDAQSVIAKSLNAKEELQKQLEADARWRLSKASSEATMWHDMILGCCESLPERIALNEPFAQRGVTLDELFSKLPLKDSTQSLVIAWKRVGEPGRYSSLFDGITNTAGWSDERIFGLYSEVMDQLDWGNTVGGARKWWEAFENLNKTRMPLVLRLAEELAIRDATITDFFLCFLDSHTDNIQGNLHYLDYNKEKKSYEELKLKTFGESNTIGAGATADDFFRPSPNGGIIDSSDWSQDEVLNELNRVEQRIHLGNTSGAALKFWNDLKITFADSPRIVLRLAEELNVRATTVTEFHQSFLAARTDNLQAALFYFDYSRIKAQEDSRLKAQEDSRLKEQAEKFNV